MTIEINELGRRSKAASAKLAVMTEKDKNAALHSAADALIRRCSTILAANEADMQHAAEVNMPEGMRDRLRLDEKRVAAMADGLRSIASLPDPIGEILSENTLENGLQITKRRVPIGVIGIIYEARPNVTSDAFGIGFKSGNAVILRGGSDAIHSNLAIVRALREGLSEVGADEDAVLLIENTSRESARAMMRCNEYIDCLIPRGSAGLIQTVVKESTVPVIETGAGNCHIYVDEAADLLMAVRIIINAKTQRIGVCNACESLVVHKTVLKDLLEKLKEALAPWNVELRGDSEAKDVLPDITAATEEDWAKEYLDYILSVKTVSSLDEAIAHINRYHTQHSDSIVTADETAAERFLKEIDSACVYWNASTRFTDGGEFGFGAEIGISTQKLHARGPMGLKELTSYKYEIRGTGQTR